MRHCHIHTELLIENDAPCPACVAAWHERRPAEAMTGEEREREMGAYEILEISFDMIHQRIEELVGRPVYTHEMTSSNWPYLLQEARNRVHPSHDAVLNLIPEEKRILLRRSEEPAR